ncbi:MAG: DKNYY domain-containing protein [Vicinamibacterales bacterium]
MMNNFDCLQRRRRPFEFGLGFVLLASVLACSGYHRSGDHIVYSSSNEGNGHQSCTLDGADVGSFETLDHGYARDRNRAYLRCASIAGSQPASFVPLSETYAKDAARVYYEGKQVPGADPASFSVIDLNFGRDRGDVYDHDSPIHACDPASFRLVTHPWAMDAKCAYVNGLKLPGAEPASFVVINDTYAKDEAHVYTDVRPYVIAGADAASFELTTKEKISCDAVRLSDAKDRSRYYRFGEVCSGAKR